MGINRKMMRYAASEPEEPPAAEDATVSPIIDLNALDLKVLPIARLSGIISDRNEAAAELLGDAVLLELVGAELLFLGRSLYRAATSLSAGGFDILDVFRPERSLSEGIVNALALGMFIELYFDGDMNLRPTPQEGPFTGLFELQTQGRFAPCIQKLTELLAPSKQLLFAVPSTEPMTADLRISFEIPIGSKAKLLTSGLSQRVC